MVKDMNYPDEACPGSRAKGRFAAPLTQGRLIAHMFRMNGLLAICAICREITS